MPIKNYLHFIKEITKLFKEFKANGNLTANEFLQKLLQDGRNISDTNTKQFLVLTRHEEFFHMAVEKFWKFYNLKSFNEQLISVLMYIIIFVLEEHNYPEVTNAVQQLQFAQSDKIWKYFSSEENLIEIVQSACRVFDNDYVLLNILHPLFGKMHLITAYVESLEREETSKKHEKKEFTVFSAPSFFRRKTLNSNRHIEFDTIPSKIELKPVPRSTYVPNYKTTYAIQQCKRDNRKNALKLLELAKTCAFSCASVSKPIYTEEPEVVQPFQARKLPPVKKVSIKRNVATLMREAAAFSKSQENEIKRLNELTSGGFNIGDIEALEEEVRIANEQKYLQDIERKHLQGQITHEEALISKQNLLKLNQEKMQLFKDEQLKFQEEIDAWREEEQIKIQKLVEKSQNIEKAAKEAEKKLHEQKYANARMIDYESKEIAKEIYLEKQKELAKKYELIQQLKALHQLRSLNEKKFDPTESPNFGFLCEMSIAELQERLGLLKIQLEEELKEKRKAIIDNKEKQQKKLETIEEFVEFAKNNKMKLEKPKQKVTLQDTPDLINLRERLQQVRSIRSSF